MFLIAEGEHAVKLPRGAWERKVGQSKRYRVPTPNLLIEPAILVREDEPFVSAVPSRRKRLGQDAHL